MSSSAAVITTVKRKSYEHSNDLGVYLHYNGDPDSVKAFLIYCKICKFRPPEIVPYGWARLCQVIANYFGPHGLSVGIDLMRNLPTNTDYGVYVIKDWDIVHLHPFGQIPSYDESRVHAMALEIDSKQPVRRLLPLNMGSWVAWKLWKSKIKDSTPVIDRFDGDYRFLSNFYPAEVWFEGLRFPSAEHAYQAAKYMCMDDRLKIMNLTAGQAKRYRGKSPIRADWFAIKIRVMIQVVADKFSRNSELADLLLKTENAVLVEGNDWGDCFWGVCGSQGENWLGVILMEIRNSLRSLRDCEE